MTRARRTSALFAAALLALGACTGGGDDTAGVRSAASASPGGIASGAKDAPVGEASDDAAEITALTRSVVLADEVGNICREKFSVRFVSKIFRTVKHCEKSWMDEEKDERATSVDVSNIRVHKLSATATVRERGGIHEGLSGTWGFIRVGDRWLVADWGIDYLRSLFAVIFSPQNFADDEDEGNLFSFPEVVTCFQKKAARLSDADFRGFLQGTTRGERDAKERLESLITSCSWLRDATGLTAFRRSFEVGVRKEVAKAGVQPLTDCISKQLRVTVPDERLRELIADGAEGKKVIHSRMRAALLDCALKKV